MRIFFVVIAVLYVCTARAELPSEKVGMVETLPEWYPEHWVVVLDVAFDHMAAGKLLVVDPLAGDVRDYFKGTFDGSYIPMLAQSVVRSEMYVLEHFYSRTTRGERTNVVTIYDKKNLTPIDEIILTGSKRAEMLPSKYLFELIDDDRLLLAFTFSPATGVTVIDTARRKVVNEIQMPNCAAMYPTGKRGFSALCGNGSMISYKLSGKGQVKTQRKTEPFFDIDEDALFEKPAIINGIAYFPTFRGYLREIDLRGDFGRIGSQWSLLGDDERRQGWRPGGSWPIAADDSGRFHVIMHAHGAEGTHKDPGTEVWTFDAANKARVRRIALKTPAFAIEATGGKKPLLIATNIEMNLDVYDAVSGNYVRTLSDLGQEGPLLVYRVP